MQRQWHLAGRLGILVFVCGGCLLSYLIYTQPIQHSVPLQELLVDPEIFSSGWEVRLRGDQDWEFIPERAVREDHWAKEGVMRALQQKEDKLYVWHRIFRYQNPIQAEKAFLLDLPGGFSGPSWHVPKGWDYRSSSADRFRFACTYIEVRGQFLCSAMAQYGEIISVLWFYENEISLQRLKEMERILASIDGKIEQALKRK